MRASLSVFPKFDLTTGGKSHRLVWMRHFHGSWSMIAEKRPRELMTKATGKIVNEIRDNVKQSEISVCHGAVLHLGLVQPLLLVLDCAPLPSALGSSLSVDRGGCWCCCYQGLLIGLYTDTRFKTAEDAQKPLPLELVNIIGGEVGNWRAGHFCMPSS